MTSWSYNQLWNLCTFGIALMDSYSIKIFAGVLWSLSFSLFHPTFATKYEIVTEDTNKRK